MRVLLFEQFHGGHYFNYLHALIPALAAQQLDVVVALTPRAAKAQGSPRQALAQLPGVQWIEEVAEVSPALPLKARLQSARELRRMIDRVKPDYTLVPSADSTGLGMALSGLSGRAGRWADRLEPTFHYGYGRSAASLKQKAKEALYQWTYRLQPTQRINFVNFQYWEDFVARFPALRERARLVGDPVPQPEHIGRLEARRLLGIPEDGRYIGLLGGLDTRKAVIPLVKAFRRAQLSSTDRLLLGGRLDPSYRAWLQASQQDLIAQGRLILIDRFLSDQELAHGYEALDVATPVYHEFPGLASLALKAIAAQRPILVNRLGWSARLVDTFKVGAAVDLADEVDMSRTMAETLDAAASHQQDEATRRLLAFHHEQNFAALMLEGCLQHAGLPSKAVRWDWVMQACGG
jgi:glycosyltransferase involved in cell wall biosynthesis